MSHKKFIKNPHHTSYSYTTYYCGDWDTVHGYVMYSGIVKVSILSPKQRRAQIIDRTLRQNKIRKDDLPF